jgi:hypothetical protein
LDGTAVVEEASADEDLALVEDVEVAVVEHDVSFVAGACKKLLFGSCRFTFGGFGLSWFDDPLLHQR